MIRYPRVLTVNSSFQELEHLAAALAEAGLLSRHIRPYANKGRIWEQVLARLPFFHRAYGRTLGRRRLVNGLPCCRVKESAVILDIVMALADRVPIKHRKTQAFKKTVMHARTCALERLGAKAFDDEDAIVASWGMAELGFLGIRNRGGLCVLNYPLAHHAFTYKFLLEEAERETAFADTLIGHDMPEWLVERMDHEIALADKILVGSSFVKDSFLSEDVPQEKIVVIPYGADTRLFSPPEERRAINRDRFSVLFVGQIGQRKGISYLLRAFKRFAGPGVSLTLVGKIQGDGRAFTPWRHMFRHIPNRPQKELAKLYQEVDVFLFPTLVEGMGIVVLEAMASGLPVITTPNGPGDIVRDGVDGFLVPPRDVETIVERLERLQHEPDLRAWMGCNARERALMFTWDVYRKKAVGHVKSWLQDVNKN